MAIILDTITLPDTLSLAEPYGNPLVVSSLIRTLGGKPITTEHAVTGEPITLVGEADRGWISFLDLQNLRILASVPGAVYVLNFEGVTSNVRFRHEDQPVISADPIVPRPNHDPTDQFNNVVINLMKI